jgi:WhiB family redox-sensing transcriptional regulator
MNTAEFGRAAKLRPEIVELMTPRMGRTFELDAFMRRPGWQARSACRGLDIRGFFPEGTAISLETRRTCAGCAVSAECLSFALAHPSLRGVWAGTSERERARARAVLRRQTSAAC